MKLRARVGFNNIGKEKRVPTSDGYMLKRMPKAMKREMNKIHSEGFGKILDKKGGVPKEYKGLK